MTGFLAKSDGETIVEHTQNLLENFALLQRLYPEINVDWEKLKIACIYHDLGKMNAKFQQKLQTHQKMMPGELPHGLVSIGLLPIRKWIKEKIMTPEEVKVLTYAIALHHERNMREISKEDCEREWMALEEQLQSFPYEELELEELAVRPVSEGFFKLNAPLRPQNIENYQEYVMIKGLLNRLDYAASAHIPVEWQNDFLMKKMSELLQGWQNTNPEADWNDLQRYMLAHQEENVVVLAQTGLGKTEAGLLWGGNHKIFFTLPLRAAINAIYERLREKIVKDQIENRIALLHSEIYQEYQKLEEKPDDADRLSSIDLLEYETKTKQLSLPVTVCTLDQLFDIVYQYGGHERKLATLSYSKVIIDEIQMYSSKLLAYLLYGLKMIQDYGGKFAVLTATLPPYILDLMRKQGLIFNQEIPTFFDEKLQCRHAVQVIHEEINIEQIEKSYQENKILVICNTIKKAKEIYQALGEKMEDVHLLHSQFIKKDRREKEVEIFEFGQLETEETGIWVTTQVVEASLDIDFDLLFTELSDLSGLFQRMGRCYRKRSWSPEVGTNVYVYDGGKKKCSGIGYVVDKEIFQLSKEAIYELEGPLTEPQKMALIAQTFTTEKVENTKFYQDVVDNLTYLSLILAGQFEQPDVRKRFREIDSRTVIPAPIYERYQQQIEEAVNKMQTPIWREMEDSAKSAAQKKRKEGRNELNQYTLSVPGYAFDFACLLEPIEINDYERVDVYQCDYSFEEGVNFTKPELESNIF